MKVALRFAIAVVLVITVVLSVGALQWFRREVGLFEEDVSRDAQTMGRALAPLVAETWAEDEVRARRMVESANERERVLIRLVLFDTDASDQPRVPREQLGELWRGANVVAKAQVDGVESLVTYVPVALPGGRLAALELAESMERERDYVRGTLTGVISTTALLILLTGAVAIAVGVAVVGRPMKALVEHARRIGAGQMSSRTGVSQRDEIGELATELDGMAERLERTERSLREEVRERERALEQLRHADKLATIGRLASGVAHELGTPLQVIGGHASMLAEPALPESERIESVQEIRAQANRMSKIIRELLDFARRPVAHRSRIVVLGLLERCVGMLAPMFPKGGCRITVDVEPEDLAVHGDSEHLGQAITNLLVNAVQAMPEGGAVRVEARPEDVVANEAGWVIISVMDEGVGMTADVAERVFEPFFTTKDVGQGTGLGLSVVHGIVTEHGGTIALDTSPGRGATFRLRLPVGATEPA